MVDDDEGGSGDEADEGEAETAESAAEGAVEGRCRGSAFADGPPPDEGGFNAGSVRMAELTGWSDIGAEPEKGNIFAAALLTLLFFFAVVDRPKDWAHENRRNRSKQKIENISAKRIGNLRKINK